MMAAEAPHTPLSVYMLADHLDAALAAGEDLLARGGDWRRLLDAPGNMQTFPQRLRAIVEDIRGLEMIAIARILKARDHAQALAKMDKRFFAVANLFASGTAVLLDAVEACGDATVSDFDTADGLVAYVRGRGLIAPDAAGMKSTAELTIDDSFLVARKAALGPLMDMAAAFLDALEAHYDLFVADEADQTQMVSSRGAANIEGNAIDLQIAAARAEADADVEASPPSSPISTRDAPKTEFARRERMSLN
ncbi:MAG: hypothetical protein AB7S74_11875 [Hyphomicrobium sp.]